MRTKKQIYENARHHAWAGSVLLALLLAVRIILETTNTDIDDTIIIGIAVVLIFYTLISVIFTYKFRSGISEVSEQKIVHIHKSEDAKQDSKLEKERLKLEKKKAKAEVKKKKKEN
jgi:H+/gluconate symporter-like permease